MEEIKKQMENIQRESNETRIKLAELTATMASFFEKLDYMMTNFQKIVEDNVTIKTDNNWFKSISNKIFIALGSLTTVCISSYLFLYNKIDQVEKTHQDEIAILQQQVTVDGDKINEKNFQKN